MKNLRFVFITKYHANIKRSQSKNIAFTSRCKRQVEICDIHERTKYHKHEPMRCCTKYTPINLECKYCVILIDVNIVQKLNCTPWIIHVVQSYIIHWYWRHQIDQRGHKISGYVPPSCFTIINHK